MPTPAVREDTELSSADLRDQAKRCIEEADRLDAAAAEEAARAARKATPGRMSAREMSGIIQSQLDKRTARDKKRRLDAMDRPTVNMQALEIIRKRTEPSTISGSGSVPIGEAPDVTENTSPSISPPEPGAAPPADSAGSSGGSGTSPGLLQPGANGMDPGTDSLESGQDGSSGEDTGEGPSSPGAPKEPFLQ